MNLVFQSFKSAYQTIQQWIVDGIFDYIVKIKTQQTIRKCIQYNAKFYMVQQSSFSFSIFRKGDLGPKKGRVSFLELSEKAAFIAYPHIHNIKNYKRNGKKRIKIRFF